jgi:hypothetical protein
MIRKLLSTVLLVTVLAAAGYAAEGDNAAAGAAEKPSGAPSYFEGVWAGAWSSQYNPSYRHNFTLTIGKRGEGGVFPVEYAWEMNQLRNRMIPAGSLKTKGRQEGDQFSFTWKNKQGDEQKITLRKEGEDKAKARLDRGGVLPPNEAQYYESYLNRK